jgi:hypothetical protein
MVFSFDGQQRRLFRDALINQQFIGSHAGMRLAREVLIRY